MRYLKTLVAGICAGLFIALGGVAFVVCSANNLSWLGAILFSCGLMSVCAFQAKLYTGKIGFAFHSSKEELLDLPIMFIGNIIGAVVVGYLLFFALPENFITAAQAIAEKRMNEAFYVPIIMSFFCGILVYLAVYGWKVIESLPVKAILLILCVTVFVICGMQHCIANMFYFSLANMWNLETLLNILYCVIGNSIGAIAIDSAIRFFKSEKNK